MTDHELLQEYATHHSDEAFTELVERHADWVYSVARRQVRDGVLAEDVAQAVFVTLARKASTLSSSVSISGWLFMTTRYAAATAMRIERRRRIHEKQAAAMKTETQTHGAESDWSGIEPTLDNALGRLSVSDREAVILRFFRGLSHNDIATALNISSEAAQKRVNRAVARLRSHLGTAAGTVPVASLTAVLATHSTHAAPSQLAANSLSALKGGLDGRTELIVKGIAAMRKAFVAKVATGIVLGVVVAAAATTFTLGHGHPTTPVMTVPISAASTTTLPAFDVSSVKIFQRTAQAPGGITWTEWQSPGKAVKQRLSAPGWSATHLLIGPSEWVYRTDGTLVLQKKPMESAGALVDKLQSDLASLQGVPVTRETSLDATVNNIRCPAYRLPDSPGKSKNAVVYIDPETHRPARMTNESPVFDATFTYDPPVAADFFQLPAIPGGRTVTGAEYLNEKYPTDNALFTKEALGQVFAVHEATQDANGCYHVICSTRVSPKVRQKVADLPDDIDLGRFIADDRAHYPFQYVRLAEFRESGIRVMYLLAIPESALAPENICQIPVRLASPDALLKLPGIQRGENAGRDTHFSITIEVPLKPNAPTPVQFFTETFNAASPLVGLFPEVYFLGPRTDGGISSREIAITEFEKQLQQYLQGRSTP